LWIISNIILYSTAMKPLLFLCLFTIVSGFSSCNSKGTPTFPRASGPPYEVIVVMETSAWDSKAGTAVREELTSPVPYLLQTESSMTYTYIRPDQFKGILKNVRNILIVTIDDTKYTKASLFREDNKWARGQIVLYITAPDTLSVENFLVENQRRLVNYYNKEELRRMAENQRQSYSTVVFEKVKDMFGIELYAPVEIKMSNVGSNCLWFSNNSRNGRMDLLVYSFPYTDPNTFTLEYLVAKRDSITKLMVPGSHPGSYMTTEHRVVDYEPSTLNGKFCGVLRGLWRMQGDMMGGPFVSFARVDEPNRRVIVTEGFVYEPKRDKRNYIRRMEATLYTTRFPDELN